MVEIMTLLSPHKKLKNLDTLSEYALIKKKIFLIYKAIQDGTVANSYMTNGLLMYGEIFAHFLVY